MRYRRKWKQFYCLGIQRAVTETGVVTVFFISYVFLENVTLTLFVFAGLVQTVFDQAKQEIKAEQQVHDEGDVEADLPEQELKATSSLARSGKH